MNKKLVLERVCEGSDYVSTTIYAKYGKSHWNDIVTGKCYSLHKLIEEGWEIEDVKVSSSRCCSSNGYVSNLDHTILILVKNDRGNNK